MKKNVKKKLSMDVRVEDMNKSKLRTIIELVVFGIATVIGMLIIMRCSV